MQPLSAYRIVATKRADAKYHAGERIEGITMWDGISSIYVVTLESGEHRYVSDLDHIEVLEKAA